MVDPLIAFASHVHDEPVAEVRVNFGMLAGREATPAEIDDLAAILLKAAPQVSIISEQRHEISRHVEASLHQVRIELQYVVDDDPAELDSLERALVDAAERWAVDCAASRHVDV